MLFAKKNCTECGQMIKRHTGMRLKDGNCICATCKEVIPDCIRGAAKRKFAIEDYRKAKKWFETSANV